MIDGRIISESEFSQAVAAWAPSAPSVAAVTGPGRSGAVAAVYVSHLLGVPFLPFKALGGASDPLLVIDTAQQSGRTLRKAANWYAARGKQVFAYAFYNEPPRVRFWYEARRRLGLPEYEPLAERLGAGLQSPLDGFDSRAALHTMAECAT